MKRVNVIWKIYIKTVLTFFVTQYTIDYAIM